jgi:hypothetical protein
MQIKNKGRMVNGGILFEITWDDETDFQDKVIFPQGPIDFRPDRNKEERIFLGSRCGISWPVGNVPGYFLILAQEAKRTITGECYLWVVSEFKAETLMGLFQKMFDQMGIFGAFEIFADNSPRFSTFMQALDNFKRSERALQDVIIKPAPFYESFLHGFDNIKKWLKVIKGLTIPKQFAIHSQLREIREDDLKGEPENKWFAINALRHVLCAFETSPLPESTKNRVTEEGIPPEAWT